MWVVVHAHDPVSALATLYTMHSEDGLLQKERADVLWCHIDIGSVN